MDPYASSVTDTAQHDGRETCILTRHIHAKAEMPDMQVDGHYPQIQNANAKVTIWNVGELEGFASSGLQQGPF